MEFLDAKSKVVTELLAENLLRMRLKVEQVQERPEIPIEKAMEIKKEIMNQNKGKSSVDLVLRGTVT